MFPPGASSTPLADAAKRLDNLPTDQAEIAAVATEKETAVVGSVQVGTEHVDAAAAGGWTTGTGWFAAARARWRFRKKKP